MTKISGKTYADKQHKEVSTKVMTSGAVGLVVSLEDTDIIVNTDEINVSAFNDTSGSATNAIVFSNGADLSSTSEVWQGVGGYDDTNDEFRPLHLLKRTTGNEVPGDTDDALVVYDVGSEASSTLVATHVSPQDFNTAYTSSTTITVSGSPFTVDDSECTVVYILYKPTGSTWQSPIIQGSNGVSIIASSNVLTIAGAGTPFASADEYIIGIQYQNKSYSLPNDANQVLELSPISENYVGETLVDQTDGTDGTFYYYTDMSGYRKTGYQLTLNSGSGTITATFEGSLQDDGTAAASCTYQVITNDTFGVTNLQDVDGSGATDMWIDNSEKLSCFKYTRVKIVSSTGTVNDADWTIYSKRLY